VELKTGPCKYPKDGERRSSSDSRPMGPGLQHVGARFSNFRLGKLSREFKLRGMSIFHEIQMAIFQYTASGYSHMVGHAVIVLTINGAPAPRQSKHVDMTLPDPRSRSRSRGF